MSLFTPAAVRRTFQQWPTYDWYGKCAGVVMTVINHHGTARGAPYSSATAAYRASRIESRNAAHAPIGAVHFWEYYGTDWRGVHGNWGHVGVDMTGAGRGVLNATRYPYQSWGRGLGLSSVDQITRRVGKYLGWSRQYGSHRINLPTVAAKPTPKPTKPKPTPKPTPDPAHAPEEEEDTMYKPTVHVRTAPSFEATLAHPQIGQDLPTFEGHALDANRRITAQGNVTIFRGFMVTADRDIYTAWARTHAKGIGGDTSRTDRDDYIAIQIEASRIATELT